MHYKIHDKSSKNLYNNHKELFDGLMGHAKDVLGYHRPVTIYLLDDNENGSKPLGKTGFYDPKKDSIGVYATNRHIKDVLRSLAHELVHHKQNCAGGFDREFSTEVGYAQKDDDLREKEDEAYRLGNLDVFRDFEDVFKMENPTMQESRLIKIGGATRKKLLNESNLILEKKKPPQTGNKVIDTILSTPWTPQGEEYMVLALGGKETVFHPESRTRWIVDKYKAGTYGDGDETTYEAIADSLGFSVNELGHIMVDIVGLIPIIGIGADVANGMWYLNDKELASWERYLYASLSFLAAVPGIGYAGNAAKYLMKGAARAAGAAKAKITGKMAQAVAKQFSKISSFFVEKLGPKLGDDVVIKLLDSLKKVFGLVDEAGEVVAKTKPKAISPPPGLTKAQLKAVQETAETTAKQSSVARKAGIAAAGEAAEKGAGIIKAFRAGAKAKVGAAAKLAEDLMGPYFSKVVQKAGDDLAEKYGRMAAGMLDEAGAAITKSQSKYISALADAGFSRKQIETSLNAIAGKVKTVGGKPFVGPKIMQVAKNAKTIKGPAAKNIAEALKTLSKTDPSKFKKLIQMASIKIETLRGGVKVIKYMAQTYTTEYRDGRTEQIMQDVLADPEKVFYFGTSVGKDPGEYEATGVCDKLPLVPRCKGKMVGITYLLLKMVPQLKEKISDEDARKTQYDDKLIGLLAQFQKLHKIKPKSTIEDGSATADALLDYFNKAKEAEMLASKEGGTVDENISLKQKRLLSLNQLLMEKYI
jgi:hypothetical protein|tara:strand:- start:9070 stop:11340 length:2271 start_codon:yes stop_codon:yes gene_type:complete